MPNFGFGPPRPEPMSIAGPLFSSFDYHHVTSVSTSIVFVMTGKIKAEEQERQSKISL